MVAVAEDRTRGGLRRRKLHGGSGISPLEAGDPVTDLYYERARWYSPSLGTWISQDPAGYINGADTYQFVESDPVGMVDPSGLCKCDQLTSELEQDSTKAGELRNLLSGLQASRGFPGISPQRVAAINAGITQIVAEYNGVEDDERHIRFEMELDGCPRLSSSSSYTGQYAVDQMSAVQASLLGEAAGEAVYWGLFIVVAGI